MIGIYKITNKTTGDFYIGQSVDVERRIAEHKTPNASGNKKLHDDIRSLGVDNFSFEVIEECSKDQLNLKELQYIKKLNPYYNTIGRPVSEDTRKKISESTKKWWDALPTEKQENIIKNNLTGPKKGHIVSEDTRRKISKKISEIQKQKVVCVETGEVFNSVREFEVHVGACDGTCAAYWRGKIKSVKGFHVEKCRD